MSKTTTKNLSPDPLQTLKDLPIWSHSKTNKQKDKAPALKINDTDTHLSYTNAQLQQAQQNNQSPGSSKYVGLMPSAELPYLFLDVDVDPSGEDQTKHSKVTEELIEFLKLYPTYVEQSPSGHGLHIIYKLKTRDHETLKTCQITKMSSTDISLPITGELIFTNAFLIITEVPTDLTNNELLEPQEISLEALAQIYPKLKIKLMSKTSNVIGLKTRQRLTKAPDINDMRERLLLLPTNINFYLNRAYQQLDTPLSPNDYDHWVNVCMCLTHAALHHEDEVVQHEYYLLFDEWSQKDLSKYEGPEDTYEKWESCLRTTAQRLDQDAKYQPALTKNTLHRLVNLCYPRYEVVNHKGAIIWESSINLMTVINFHELVFKADVYSFDSMFVECHKDVATHLFPMEKAFPRLHHPDPNKVTIYLKNFELGLRVILEASLYDIPSITKCINTFKSIATGEIDLEQDYNTYDKFQHFIEAVPWDGQPRVEQVINTLKFDPHTDPKIVEHWRVGLRKCLLWLVGVRYHHKATSAPCVPILVGREGIYKSTWAKSLFHNTPFEHQYVKQVSALLKDRKELSRALQNTLIALIDEIETVMTNADKAKDVLTEDTLSVRAMYANGYVNIRKRGLIIGTTNNPFMSGSEDGNRRLMRITVQECDTDTLWTIDMQQVYAELLQEYREHVKLGNTMPWVFTKHENFMNNVLMGTATADSEDNMLLYEVLGGAPHEHEFNPKLLLGTQGGLKQNPQLEEQRLAVSVKTMTNLIVEYQQAQNYNAPIRAPKRNVVKRKLQAYAAKYTKSEHKTVWIGTTACINGAIEVKNQVLYVVPPIETKVAKDKKENNNDLN